MRGLTAGVVCRAQYRAAHALAFAWAAVCAAAPLQAFGDAGHRDDGSVGAGVPAHLPDAVFERALPTVPLESWHGFSELPAAIRANLKSRVRALLGPAGLPNARVSDPAGDVAREVQSYPSVAAWNQYVVVAFRDSRGFRTPPDTAPPYTTTSFAYSCDYGTTFTDGGNVPRLAADEDANYPTVTADGQGNFYLAAEYIQGLVAALTGTSQSVAVWKGSFSGCNISWTAPVLVSGDPFAGDILKPSIVADPYDGHIYVAFSRDRTGSGERYRMEVVSSGDG